MPTLQELLPQVAAHLGTGWRAIVAEVKADGDRSWADDHFASLSGPHGWQLSVSCRDGRMEISGRYAGSSLGAYIRIDGCNEIGVSMDRHPRAIANDITRRLLTKDYPTLFERAKANAQTNAAREAREYATLARLMSSDPQARYLYYRNKEAIIHKQSVTVRSTDRVLFERLEVSEAQAVLILRIVAAGYESS